MALSTGTGIPLEPVTTAQFAQAWPLLISNTYRCTAGDSRCSTRCSLVLHPFLMTNSHPLHLFFMPFEPIAHLLQTVVLATVSSFFPTVLELVRSDWSTHLLHGPKPPPTICKSSSNLLLPVANTAIASTDVNDANCLVEDLWELQSDGESAGQGSSLTQETMVQQSRKR